MDFINKLIKRGIFGLVMCFSFFAFFGGENVKAETSCSIELKDGEDYLLLNTSSVWNDSGVTATCDGEEIDEITVTVNGDVIDFTSDTVESHLSAIGSYEITYYVTDYPGFFVTRQIDVEPSNCPITINDGNKYLVLNTTANWSDSGVTAYCDGVRTENVSVSINNDKINLNSEVVGDYLKNAGFYKIKYYITNYPKFSVTRQVRVLPTNLNSVRNIWLGDFNENTGNDDVFVKIIDYKTNYLAVGNFGTTGYVVLFNSLGEYLWHQSMEKTVLYDIVKSGDTSGNVYYVVGQYTNASSQLKGFLKAIQMNTDSDGFREYGNTIEFPSMSVANKVVSSVNYVFVSGYLVKADGSTIGEIARLTKNDSSLGGAIYYSTTYNSTLETKYNSLLIAQGDDGLNVIAAGSTAVENNAGSIGGLITVCNENFTSCSNKGPYLWQNSNGASTTKTEFSDIILQGTNYLVVGNSRIDKVEGSATTTNSGLEDSLILLLNSSYEISDVTLTGGTSSDGLYSIKKISESATAAKFVAVGKKATQGVYLFITVGESKLTFEENVVAGRNGNVEFKDVFVNIGANEEIHFIFVGATQATIIENIILTDSASGANDALFVILDNTGFSNYENINILQNAPICDGDLTSCSADKLYETYRLLYGTSKVVLSAGKDISSGTLGTTSAYHTFKNAQGVTFILGRNVIVSENPIAPDISVEEMGIDKWYLYSRPQTIGENVGNKVRANLWETRYFPVDNSQDKVKGMTYYVISGNDFVVDKSDRDYTYNNYVLLEDEPLNSTVAFQSVEKANEFALAQEFTRIAFVKGKYDYNEMQISPFDGESTQLVKQNYYFIYYIDLAVNSSGECKTTNNVIEGNCTRYTGYIFASLSRIKKVATSIVEKYNNFVSESNTRFNPNGSVSLPKSTYFAEEMATEKYFKSTSIKLGTTGLYLEVNHYPVVKGTVGYTTSDTAKTTFKTGQDTVTFAAGGDYADEGKYVVRYCYNYQEGKDNSNNCGGSATFIIDRTAPIINYTANGQKGTLSAGSTKDDPQKIGSTATISSIDDLDPYAYTIVNNKKYYLQCNLDIKSASCGASLTEYIYKSYSYQENNLFNIVVYDRAGNSINAYFKVGTLKPEVFIDDKDGDDNSFVLNVNFFGKNDISDLIVDVVLKDECGTNDEDCLYLAEKIDEAITEYIAALTYKNNVELANQQENSEYEPIIDYDWDFTFILSRALGGGSGGLVIPQVTKTVVDGKTVYDISTEKTTTVKIYEGLYIFTLGDTYYNSSEAYGGIGLGKAELYAYVNADDEAEENIADMGGVTPKTQDEIVEGSDTGDILLVKEPLTYQFENIIHEDFSNDLDKDMFFTNKFIYIKFAKNDYGYIRIRQALNLNPSNGYGASYGENSNLGCLFNIYGSEVNPGIFDSDCVNISISELFTTTDEETGKIVPKELMLKGENGLDVGSGIYFISSYKYTDNVGEHEYYYLAFTKEETYDVGSEIYAELDLISGSKKWAATPVYYSFTIDKTAPVISFDVACPASEDDEKAECITEPYDETVYDNVEEYILASGDTYRVNIGQNNVTFRLDLDYIMTDVINRLMVVSVNGELYNAYDYAKQKTDTINGNYITFVETGTYKIKFYDAAKNEVTYTFIIDNAPPVIGDVVDINGKDLSTYQQYVEVELAISEGSFLDKAIGETMVLLYYWIEDGAKQEITIVVGAHGECVLSTGNYESGSCSIEETSGAKRMSLKLVIPINKADDVDDRASEYQTLSVSAMDYFGKENVRTYDFVFDNIRPYSYFSSEYTPVRVFGEAASNDDRDKMLSRDADSSITSFTCENGMKFTVGQEQLEKTIIYCGDTPTDSAISNNVTIQGYEAYRATYNNYKQNSDQSYTLMPNGTYLSVRDVVYKKNFVRFTSAEELEEDKGSVKIYTQGAFIKVTMNEYIDPNKEYHLDTTGTNKVSISDMYSNVSKYEGCSKSSEAYCTLYNMYMSDGTFAKNQNFYVYDRNEYTELTSAEVGNIDTSDENYYLNYYYSNGYVVDQGKYLPALTLENSCVLQGSKCVEVAEGKIKLDSAKYYNVVNLKSADTSNSMITSTAILFVNAAGVEISTRGMLDNRIWQIAVDTSKNKVNFSFGLASNLGRPIIFVATDGAGNTASNYLETVIAIKDAIRPQVGQVSSVSYRVDNSSELTNGNYIIEEKYYKLYGIEGLVCDTSTSQYFVFDEDDGSYDSVNCADLKEGNQYYSKVREYVPVADKQTRVEGVTYYKADKVDLGTNYLTGNNLIVKFNEPIYRIECSYFVYNSKTGEEYTKSCNFNNSEFDYSDGKVEFELIYEPLANEENYFVNYSLTVYDFSNNSTTVKSLFIDRDTPVIRFNEATGSEDSIEVNYVDSNDSSVYNATYISEGFYRETTTSDSINFRISDQGLSNIIKNTYSYEVEYYKFRYDITYNNYTLAEGENGKLVPKSVTNGEAKSEEITYYVLVKKPTNYVLKGNSGICEVKADGEYCYIVDDYNYYPDLRDNEKYWTKLSAGEYIKNNKVGVYKIEYRVIDYSKNVSETLTKTVYCVDTTTPTFISVDKVSKEETAITKAYGYHKELIVKIAGEKEAMLYKYNCKDGVTTCELPQELFENASSNAVMESKSIVETNESTYNTQTLYKLYLHDKGSYIESINGSGEKVMVLKYNVVEYTFLIDTTPPKLYLNAYEDLDGDLYYHAHLDSEETLYCVRSARNGADPSFDTNSVQCKNNSSLFSSEGWVENKSESSITRQLYNSSGELVYQEVYEKISSVSDIFKTYYYMSGNALIAYSLGAEHDASNIYVITSIDLYFREDGQYLIKAQDKSGNIAGRFDGSGLETDQTKFIIDNTRPTYNKNQNKPTGANYWFSVPGQIVTIDNMSNLVNLNKESDENSYNILTSNLNKSFFYAFASKTEAASYLASMYNADISSLSDNTCTITGGVRGFNYTYYDPSEGRMINRCFVGTDGESNKNAAADYIITNIISKMIYPTFSGGTLFSEAIMQRVCDSSVSSNCSDSNDLYKVVYLEINTISGAKSVVQTCSATANIECIKINAKIIKYDRTNTENNKIPLKIKEGDAIDTSKIVVYGTSFDITSGEWTTTDSTTYTQSWDVPLQNNSYYIFEEFDETIEFRNHGGTVNGTVTHYNTTYYAVYVDNTGFIDVYYKEVNVNENGETEIRPSEVSLNVANGIGNDLSNWDEYYLIIKNNGDKNFANNYEIYTFDDGKGNVEVYSYMILRIDGFYYNINDYLEWNKEKTEYFFEIPIPNEAYTAVEFIDRTGTITKVYVSMTQIAPEVTVTYEGNGGTQTATLFIKNRELSSVDKDTITIEFTTDLRLGYSTNDIANIRNSLLCKAGSGDSAFVYGCANTDNDSYRVVISNKESLYGFFKVTFTDSHENTNSIEFVYNPAEMNADYTNNIRFIDNNMDSSNSRMISNDKVKLEFNNQINYVILYKVGTIEPIMNTKESYNECGSNNYHNCLETVTVDGQYDHSILYYNEEGTYYAKIVNRASEVIYEACFVDGELREDCKNIKSSSTYQCSWIENPDMCDDALEVINRDVVETDGNSSFNKLEIDKTAPTIDIGAFIVTLPSGSEAFVNGETYTNAEITISWAEKFVQLGYICTYVGSDDDCAGNHTGFSTNTSHTFVIPDKLVTDRSVEKVEYEFWFEDYAGNSTQSNRYSFAIAVELPEIAVYAIDENGIIIENGQIVEGTTINKNVQLLCYVDHENDNRCATYDVVLERFNGSGFVEVISIDPTRVSESYGNKNTYRYTVSIKNSTTGYVYTNLRTQFIFTIDRQSPVITLEGNLNDLWGIYKGEVTVMISEGVGTIYFGCENVGEDDNGDKIYNCNEEPLVEEFTSNYRLNETGVYRIIARDAYGNVTQGREIKYVSIDNEKPDISVEAKGQFLNYPIAENGFTNSETIIVTSSDNNEGSYFKYRVKDANDIYGEWITHSFASLELTEEGFYEVVPIDAIGNEGMERHFIIYRQAPRYTIMVGNRPSTINDIIEEDFKIYWNEQVTYSYQAPIIKVTMNGMPYAANTVVKETGEYLFVFVDLAGNMSNIKIAINKNPKICLNNIGVTPKEQFLMHIDSTVIASGDYKFSEDDVIVLATPANYFGGSSACGTDTLNYRSIDKKSYILVGDYASYANANKQLPIRFSDDIKNTVNELGGYVYAIVVSRDVAKNELGFPIGENFFTKDPLGWTLIFLAGIGVLAVGVKLVFFRKKVRVLK